MTSSAAQDLVNQTSELIAGARSLVAFTGAGISTPSGIPDFRSAGSGLWTRSDPMAVASLTAFHRRPEVFFNWLRPLARKIALASPNPAHRALGALESAGILKAVITQNIDGLHQRGGNKNVIEIHGSLDRWICMNCREEYPSSDYLGLFLDEEINPACPRCNSLLKPGITLFEEMLPVEAWEAACDLSTAADYYLIVGSSLEVYPANELPQLAYQHGAQLMINNRTETYLDRRAKIILRQDAAEVLPAIADQVLSIIGQDQL